MGTIAIYLGMKAGESLVKTLVKELKYIINQPICLIDSGLEEIISPQNPIAVKYLKKIPQNLVKGRSWWGGWVKFQMDTLSAAEGEHYLSDKLEILILHLLTAVSIARPGECDFGRAFITYNSKFLTKVDSFLSYFSEYNDCSWPPIKSFPIEKAVNWAHKKEGFLKGISKTPIERALNSFSYLFFQRYSDSNELTMVWALRGLEAVYASGKSSNLESKQEQLVKKSILFLGVPPKDVKYERKIREMYNYRSRFLHGDLDVHTKTYRYTDEYFDETFKDGDEEDEYYGEELVKHTHFAVQMLVATLQKCVENNIDSIEYKIELVTS